MEKNGFKRVYLYGLAKAEKMYMPVSYVRLTDDPEKGWAGISIDNIVRDAVLMKARNPSVDSVYVIDDYYGLLWDYKRVIKHLTIEECAVFKNTLETRGIKVL